ncbi:MAG: PhoPQ-activated pathogenicity [Planctomycetota bacterium]|nr:MAG: PhoPQ-activated pathogenicity [Planctomycetota bacterium]
MRRAVSCCAFFTVALACLVCCGAEQETALDRYIAEPDPAYEWKLADTIKGDGYTTYVIDLTSQTWRSEKDVDRPLWKHWLTIVKPDNLKYHTAFLYIGGGSNNDPQPKASTDRTVELAKYTGSIVAELGTVPNQPLAFTDSKDEQRYEDNIIAYTRVKYIATRDPKWLVRLAMVKSGVRAMDAMQEFFASEAGGEWKLDQFVVAGGSKRGWTTWLVGVVDKRVRAIIPIVIDALNSEEITRHHYRAYGFFSPALKDYVRHGLFPDKVGSPEYREILAIEDPYNYRHREALKMPKYVINASGDQFFLPDNSQFYFDELPQPKWLRYVENAKHNLAGSDARESIAAFYLSILEDKPGPQFSWKLQDEGTLRVTVEDKPGEVNLWQATNPDARDFRLDTIGKAYEKSTLEASSDGSYVAKVAKPPKGFTAYFVELVYPTGHEYPLKFTTDVYVTPDVLPFEMPSSLK